MRSTSPGTLFSQAGISDVRDDATTLAAYTSDASLYRLTPQVVVLPRNDDEVSTALDLCRREGLGLTSRGGGTSVAGNAIGNGVVLDFSRHMNRVLEIDPATRLARVEPGTVHAALQNAAAPHGLRFGPDPSTHTRCTIGGMIGNNACGARTLGYGRTSDNVHKLEVITGTGDHLTLETGQTAEHVLLEELRGLTRENLSTIRTEFGRFGRQVSGYSLEHLLPERKFDITRFLVGTEGTLAVSTAATVRLVSDPTTRLLVALGYPDIASAGDDAPSVLTFKPTACEAIDSRIVAVVRERRGNNAVPPLPRGAAWLFVEIAGEHPDEVRERAEALLAGTNSVDGLVVDNPALSARLWRIREDGAGLAGRSPAGLPAHAGWEDAAVPPAKLGAYLRDFERLMSEFGLTGLPYGHFGDGCLHIRLDLPLNAPNGRDVFRRFLSAAAEQVAQFGGSLSGEHGDGRARSELLSLMYSPDALKLFGAVKSIFDPDNILNPGVIVDPAPIDRDLRISATEPLRENLALAYRHDGGDFSQAVHRCTGVGKCRADNTSETVMCPSYAATREEKDSTRGRARVLQEMINGTTVTGGWRSPEVHEALDLCLSCKGCSSDCPTGTDMAAFKSEVLHQSYKNRIRPASHYSLGWLPRWAKIASVAPQFANFATSLPGIGPLALNIAGVDPRRNLPSFAPQTFRKWFAESAPNRPLTGDPVVIFVDTFTNFFTPEVGIATVKVLEAAGFRPQLTAKQQCCGLTWISTGQLDAAKRIMARSVADLATFATAGIPIVGIEPSCTGALRSDSLELLESNIAVPVAESTHTLAELLDTKPGWAPPALLGRTIVAQPHCHHHAVMGWGTDAQLLKRAGAQVTRVGGCCGLAGNFGVEKGHYDVSLAVAEQHLLPEVRSASTRTTILADGYSCRTQLADLTDRRGQHLAQLLADHLD